MCKMKGMLTLALIMIDCVMGLPTLKEAIFPSGDLVPYHVENRIRRKSGSILDGGSSLYVCTINWLKEVSCRYHCLLYDVAVA